MRVVAITVPPKTEEFLEEISAVIEKSEGSKPSRSHLFRLAVAQMRQRMINDGSICDGEVGT